MRFLAPPPTGGVVLNGSQRQLIDNLRWQLVCLARSGCATCHNPTLGTTQPSNITSSLSKQPVNAYSDIEIHHMGTGSGGQRLPRRRRRRPVPHRSSVGPGQRIFLLHDGRTTNLITAIRDHASQWQRSQLPWRRSSSTSTPPSSRKYWTSCARCSRLTANILAGYKSILARRLSKLRDIRRWIIRPMEALNRQELVRLAGGICALDFCALVIVLASFLLCLGPNQ